MAEDALGIRTWDGVLVGHPTSMCVTWWSPEGAGVPAGNTARTSAELLLKLQLIKNTKSWSLYSVVVVGFHFCDPHESFTNHCGFHIFSGLFLAVSL